MPLTHYTDPQIVVEIDHDGVTYDVSSSVARFDLTREVNAVDNATLVLSDAACDLFENKVHGWWDDSGTIKNDTIKIYCNYASISDPLTTTDLRFYGFIESPTTHLSTSGVTLQLECRSYFRCLLDLLIAEEYGSESAHGSLDTLQEILQDGTDGIIDLWVNKLLGSATNSGYAVNDSLVENIAGTITYLRYPYQPVRDAINDLVDIVQAIKTHSTAGPHWIGRTIESPADTFTHYFLCTTVGSHSSGPPDVAAQWPTYWNTTQANSTIVVTEDMVLNAFQKLPPEANYILYFGAFSRPGSGDYWTEESAGASSLWISGVGNYTCTRTSVGAAGVGGGDPMIGSTCLKLEPTNSPFVGYAFYPTGRDMGLNLENISSPTNIPRLVWYEYQSDIAQFNFLTFLCTDNTSHCGGTADHYFSGNWYYMTPVADRWYRMELPVGPYWASDPKLHDAGGPSDFYWNEIGTPDWSDINIVVFSCGDDNAYDRYIDGVHFEGLAIRGAYLSGSPYFKVKKVQDNVAKDDSLEASDDSGTIAQLAYAELLRAARRPIQGTIVIPGEPTILAGSLAHIHAAAYSGGYRINKDMRVLQHQLTWSPQGLLSYLTLTDDTKNGNPMSPRDEYNLLLSATQVADQTRTNTSLGSGQLDLTQVRLEKSYTFNDYF